MYSILGDFLCMFEVSWISQEYQVGRYLRDHPLLVPSKHLENLGGFALDHDRGLLLFVIALVFMSERDSDLAGQLSR